MFEFFFFFFFFFILPDKPCFSGDSQQHVIDYIQGDNVTLDCKFIANPAPVEVHWFHNGNNLMNTRTSKIPEKQLLRSSLFINEVSLSEAGTYRCVVQNDIGVEEYNYQVNVLQRETTSQMTSTVTSVVATTKQITGKQSFFVIKTCSHHVNNTPLST